MKIAELIHVFLEFFKGCMTPLQLVLSCRRLTFNLVKTPSDEKGVCNLVYL